MSDDEAALEPLVEDVPGIGADDVDDHSVGHVVGDGPYAGGVEFRVRRRLYQLLDKDEDGVVDFAFSYGRGPEWCVDHSAIPADVVERVEDELAPLELEIPPALVDGDRADDPTSLHFDEKHVEPIVAGEKWSTIRLDDADPLVEGEEIRLRVDDGAVFATATVDRLETTTPADVVEQAPEGHASYASVDEFLVEFEQYYPFHALDETTEITTVFLDVDRGDRQ